MNKFIIATIMMFASATSAASSSRTNPDDCVGIDRVRAFAVESDSTLIVRQAKTIYRRIEVENGCVNMDADRIGFAFGNRLAYTTGLTGSTTRITSSSIVNRMCTNTPHSNIVFIDDSNKYDSSCRIKNISPATEEEFNSLDKKDNRY